MNPQNQFLTVALPLMVTIVVAIFGAVFVNNKAMEKGFEGINRRIDDVVSRLGRIELKLVLRISMVDEQVT